MSETVLIYDEDESRAATEAQMRQTARMYGLNRGSTGPIAELPSREIRQPVRVDAQVPSAFTPLPMPPGLAMSMPPALTDHLLLTPAGREGLVRLVRMQGAHKLGSWTLHENAAATVTAILTDFGIQLTDLRESEDTDGQPV